MAGSTYRVQQRLKESIELLEKQQQQLQPILEYLTELFIKKVGEEDISANDAFEMVTTLTEQFTNSTLLLTKVQEVIEFEKLR